MIPVAVTRRSKSHNRRTDAERSERQRDLLRGPCRARGPPAAAGSRPGASCSVPTRPGASTTVAEAMTSGRSEPVRASPSASTARRSASTAPWKSPERTMSALNARWITPSDAPAAPRRPPGSSRSPRCTRAPASVRAAAEASERARPVTSWPAPMSSGTRAEPIQPDAPVTKTRMPNLHVCRSPSPQRMPRLYRAELAGRPLRPGTRRLERADGRPRRRRGRTGRAAALPGRRGAHAGCDAGFAAMAAAAARSLRAACACSRLSREEIRTAARIAPAMAKPAPDEERAVEPLCQGDRGAVNAGVEQRSGCGCWRSSPGSRVRARRLSAGPCCSVRRRGRPPCGSVPVTAAIVTGTNENPSPAPASSDGPSTSAR